MLRLQWVLSCVAVMICMDVYVAAAAAPGMSKGGISEEEEEALQHQQQQQQLRLLHLHHLHLHTRSLLRSPLNSPVALSPARPSSSSQIDPLLAFKSLITLDPSRTLLSWTNSSSSPCLWAGIACNALGSIVSITLNATQLHGSISGALAQLPHLSSLDLSNNHLTGSIPPHLCSPGLTILRLQNNSLTGPIPASLGNCSSLVALSLYSNGLTGSIPPELGKLIRLQMLALSFNRLVGPIPTTIFTNCTSLITLALSLNGFTGPLSPEVGRLSHLQNLWINGNGLSGSLPEGIANLTSINILRMDTNNFTGTIPVSISRLVSLTGLLSLSVNRLTGPIPPQLGNLTNLTKLTLMGNFLTGTIPPELGNLHSLQGLYLENNRLRGTLPSELGQCSNLEQLRLYSNRLTGSIPASLGNLQHLNQLYLHDNMLGGNIPASFSNLTSLQDLSLGYNALKGNIPANLASLSIVTFNFSLAHNLLTGPIPAGLEAMIHVQKIDLSSNNLSGFIPRSLGSCVNLIELNLSYNLLTGEIPDNLASLKLLKRLDLSGNMLSGPIPDLLSALQQLDYLNLSFNNFTGPIPSSGVFVHLNASSFLSNPGLCGAPTTRACPTVEAPIFQHKGLTVGFKVLIIFCSLIVLTSSVLLLRWTYMLFFTSRRIRARPASPLVSPRESGYASHLKKFTAQELEAATESFNDTNLIGTGGESRVYKATSLTFETRFPEKQDAAVKVLPATHRRSFRVELKTLGGIRHRNLVRILGYCDEKNVQALVLELLPKGSLEHYLHAQEVPHITLRMRVQIALGVAHGLAYLHHGLKNQIIHRDLKPSNILLDENMVAKVADFGIAKFLGPETLYTKVNGTPGYLAPEYGESMRVNVKSDIYSFGIVLLEMLSRKEPTDQMFGDMGVSLPNWVRKAYPERYRQILDPELGRDEEEEEAALKALLEVGLACTEEKPERRPSMEAVVKRLASIESSLSQLLDQPAISGPSSHQNENLTVVFSSLK